LLALALALTALLLASGGGPTVIVAGASRPAEGFEAAAPQQVSGNTAATMSSPAPGSTFAGPQVTFNWSAGSNVKQYWLYVGSRSGDVDLDSIPTGGARSASVSNLPNDGSNVYVRLWTHFNSGVWAFKDYLYHALIANTPSAISDPPPGTTLTKPSGLF